MASKDFGGRWALEIRNRRYPKILVEVKGFEFKDEALNYAHQAFRGHEQNDNEYLYLLYKVWLVGGVPVVDMKAESLQFARS